MAVAVSNSLKPLISKWAVGGVVPYASSSSCNNNNNDKEQFFFFFSTRRNNKAQMATTQSPTPKPQSSTKIIDSHLHVWASPQEVTLYFYFYFCLL